MNKRPPYFILISWLWLTGLLLFIIMVTWDIGLLPKVLDSDKTRISLVLLLLALLTTLHCAYRSYKLSRLESALRAWENNPQNITDVFLNTYLSLMLKSRVVRNSEKEVISEDNNLSLNGELLAEHFHYQHSYGWFVVGAMIKLGLLGTVIGFIMMLSSINGLDSLDIEQVQQLMQQMTQGMMVALNTTLLGLVGSLILGVQYLFLDHSADQLLIRTMTRVQQINKQFRLEEDVI